MNINFIKWMVGYAEEYHLKTGSHKSKAFEYIDYGEDTILLDDFSSCDSMALSLLLQRAIEGINLEMGIYQIDITKDCIEVWGNGLSKKIVLINGKLYEYSYDQAKEEVLKYIWEKENE